MIFEEFLSQDQVELFSEAIFAQYHAQLIFVELFG